MHLTGVCNCKGFLSKDLQASRGLTTSSFFYSHPNFLTIFLADLKNAFMIYQIASVPNSNVITCKISNIA